MTVATAGALALAGLESAKLLLSMFPNYDQRKREQFEADYALYDLQKTLPSDHPDINDDLFLRVRHRLFNGVQEINSFVKASSKNG